MVGIINKYKENVLSQARLYDEIKNIEQEQSSIKEKIDLIGNQIKELNGQRELNKITIDKYEQTIYRIRDMINFVSILFGFGLIMSLIFHSLTQMGLDSGLYLITGGTQESMKRALKHGGTMITCLSHITGFSIPLSIFINIFTPKYLRKKYNNILEYRSAKDKCEQIEFDIKGLEVEKQREQALYDSINEQIKQKEEQIRKLEIENEVLVKKYQDISARNQMNLAITQDGNPEVVSAVNTLKQIQEEYKPSDGDKIKSLSLFDIMLGQS